MTKIYLWRSESRLDHFGIFVRKQEDIDVFLKHIQENNIKIHKEKKDS